MTDIIFSEIDKFLTDEQELEITGLSKVTRWRLEKHGDYPKRRQISPHRVARLQSEILDWMNTRPVSDIQPPDRRGNP